MSTRELLRQNRSDQYRSYVVRLLRPDTAQAWRIAVEVVGTRQQANFKDVAALASFFDAEMNDGAPSVDAAAEDDLTV